MSGNSYRALWCLVAGDSTPFELNVSSDFSISWLKEHIFEKAVDAAHPVLAKDLALWKPNGAISLDPEDTLAKRVWNLGLDFSQFATKLGATRTVSMIFAQQPSRTDLNILVELPLTRTTPLPVAFNDLTLAPNLAAPSFAMTASPSVDSEISRLASNDSPAGLVSVVGPHSLHQWQSTIVAGWRPLALLHKKFWGTSMAEEEKKWRESLPSIVDRVDGLQDSAMVMDSDEDTIMDETTYDDDITPGCYVLDVSINMLKAEKVWIRADYIRVFDCFSSFYTSAVNRNLVPGGVLTGQPGIGKSHWIYYALRRLLAEETPVILYHQDQCYLFVEEGVYVMPTDYLPGDFLSVIWTLVDSDQDRMGVPPRLVAHGTTLFVVYVTSPDAQRWARMDKVVHPIVAIMNPWTRAEIHKVAPLKFPNPDFKLIHEIYDQLGPIPRLCFDELAFPHALTAYKEKLNVALEQLTKADVKKLVDTSISLRMDHISHKLCLIQRRDRSVVSEDFLSAPITDLIRSKLVLHLRNLDASEQVELYRHFSTMPAARGMTGIVFEAYCQRHFQTEISLTFVPMVRIEDSKPKKGPAVNDGKKPRRYLRQWNSSHVPLSNELEEMRQAALLKEVHITIVPSGTCLYRIGKGLDVVPNVYYLPRKTTQVALDSFIVYLGLLYIFQFTGGRQHGIKRGLIPFLRGCVGLPAVENWRFIFILADDVEVLQCPVPEDLDVRKLPLFSSIITIEGDGDENT